MFSSYFKFALRSLKYRKLRSWLTILGVIIGVAAIVSLISISLGLEDAIKEQFSKIGSNKIFIMPKGNLGSFGAGLTTKDVDALNQMSEFDLISPYVMTPSAQLTYKAKDAFVTLIGYPVDNSKQRWEGYGIGAKEGRLFKEGDKNVLILGYKAQEDLFDKKINLHSKIQIKGTDFEVIGILEEVGNNQDDMQVFVPIETVRSLFNAPDAVSAIEANVKQGLDINVVVDKVKRRLSRIRDDESFDIMTPVDILKTMSNILNVVRVVLVAIAAISLVVGAMGILNSMYTNVLERTSEIGIMKSIGATNSGIMMIFLIEAGMMGLIGGIFGVTLGYLLSKLVELIAVSAGFKLLTISFNPLLMLGGLLFAFIVGVLSGYLPSLQASKLKVIDALRYD